MALPVFMHTPSDGPFRVHFKSIYKNIRFQIHSKEASVKRVNRFLIENLYMEYPGFKHVDFIIGKDLAYYDNSFSIIQAVCVYLKMFKICTFRFYFPQAPSVGITVNISNDEQRLIDNKIEIRQFFVPFIFPFSKTASNKYAWVMLTNEIDFLLKIPPATGFDSLLTNHGGYLYDIEALKKWQIERSKAIKQRMNSKYIKRGDDNSWDHHGLYPGYNDSEGKSDNWFNDAFGDDPESSAGRLF
jgi:hypothetical protein